MSSIPALLLILLAILGNAFWWVTAVNRLHGFPLRKVPKHSLTLGMFALVPGVPLAVAVWLLWMGTNPFDLSRWKAMPWPAWAALGVCWLGAVVALAGWCIRRCAARLPAVVRYHRRCPAAAVSADRQTGGGHRHHAVMRLPGNEMLRLEVSEYGIELPRLPAALDGLSIVQITDAHFTGWVDKGYFHELVDRANAMEPDLIAVTGDLIDKPRCIDWLAETFGRLRARWGVYFVLGNHDVLVDALRIRSALTGCGMVDLGGRWIEQSVREVPVVLAGNEVPWGKPAPDLAGAPAAASSGGPLRIVLSHSPDQFGWGRRHAVDLMLAGHTHGGQVRLPGIGPILSPSIWGVRYASGLFYRPPTVLFVSRGVSGEFPIRFQCPPELPKIILHRPTPPPS